MKIWTELYEEGDIWVRTITNGGFGPAVVVGDLYPANQLEDTSFAFYVRTPNDGELYFTKEEVEIYEGPIEADVIKRPDHYQGKVQPKDLISAFNLNFYQGSAVKYASRAGRKLYEGKTAEESAILDLRKAIENCEIRIKDIEEGGL